MMFLLRTAFWLSVVIFLIPVDHAAEQQADAARVQPIGALEAASAAQQTISDMSGFCGRNPTACDIGGGGYASAGGGQAGGQVDAEQPGGRCC